MKLGLLLRAPESAALPNVLFLDADGKKYTFAICIHEALDRQPPRIHDRRDVPKLPEICPRCSLCLQESVTEPSDGEDCAPPLFDFHDVKAIGLSGYHCPALCRNTSLRNASLGLIL